MPPKSKAERLLEERAETSATAAVQLDRLHARRERAKAKPNITQLRAQDRDAQRQATSTSRSTSIVGPEQRDDYAERALAWLMLSDEEQAVNPAEGVWLDAAGEEYRQACEAFPWPDDRSPAEVAAQEQMDAGQRDVAAWFQRGAARRDAGLADPFNDHRPQETA